jgi:hypothetical protein
LTCSSRLSAVTVESCVGNQGRRTLMIESGVSILDRERALSCVARHCDASCVELDGSCEDLLTGTRSFGEGCLSSAECSGELGCFRTLDGAEASECIGTCRLRRDDLCGGSELCTDDEYCEARTSCAPRRPVGSDCEHTAQCMDGLSCGPEDTCIMPRPTGGDCGVTDNCIEGTSCGPEDTCIEPRSLGEACLDTENCVEGTFCRGGLCDTAGESGDTCQLGECAEGLYCAYGGQCAQLAPLGGECTWDGGCSEGRCQFGSCDPLEGYCGPTADDPDLTGTCFGDRQPGDVCYLTEDCAEELYCQSGTCVPRKAEGASCRALVVRECQEGLACHGSLCSVPPDYSALPELGEPCVPPVFRSDPSTCAGDAVCAIDASASELRYRCQEPRPVGAPCRFPRDCETLVCRSAEDGSPGDTVCRDYSELGEPCRSDRECASGVCARRRCVPDRLSQGASCYRDSECERGLLCGRGLCSDPASLQCVP